MPENTFPVVPVLAGLGAAVVTAAVAAAIDAFLIEPARVELTHQPLAVPDLPPAWEGASVAHLTDLHYGDPRSEALFRWMVRTVNEREPDLILITGDFVVQYPSEVKPCAEHLAGLRSRHGVLAVLGDHDFEGKPKMPMQGIEEALEAAGIRLLRNSAVELPGGLRIAGVDPQTHKVQRADLEAALAPLGNDRPHLLLSHTPDLIGDASSRDVPLVLAGHTHGGQVVIPFFGPPITHTRVGREYASGWSRKGNTRMYTGRGLASHCSLRFFCRPEIAFFTLSRANE